jgi:hypothetical protein
MSNLGSSLVLKTEDAESKFDISPRLEIRLLTGDQPKYGSPAELLIDDEKEEVIFYWLDEQSLQWQISVCNLGTGNWKNISVSVTEFTKFVNNYVPQNTMSFTHPGTALKEKRALPNHCGASSTLWKFEGSRIILLFGGEEREGSPASATRYLTAFDIDNHIWWYVDASQWDTLSPRVDACATTIDNRLFIFGGRHIVERRFVPAKSFSVAEFSENRCNWIVVDKAYPRNVPDFGFKGMCRPLRGQKKICLIRGLTGRAKHVRIYLHLIYKIANFFVISFQVKFTRDLWLFDVEHHTFEVIPGEPGALPSSIRLYYAENNTTQPLGNLRLKSENASVKSEPDDEPDLGVAPTSSILFAIWGGSTTDSDTPELWCLSLSPSTASFRCLDIQKYLEDLEVDTNTFVVVKNRSILLGCQEIEGDFFNTVVEITL